MTTLSSTVGKLDAGLRFKAAAYFEARSLEAALAIPRHKATTYAIIAMVKGELIQLVTEATLDDRRSWFKQLNLPIDTNDIDADFGVAYRDHSGVIRTAGTNEEFKAWAQINLIQHGQRATHGLLLSKNPDTVVDFAFTAELHPEGEVSDLAPEITLDEHSLVLELHGLVAGAGDKRRVLDVPLGMAWVADDDGVVVTYGRGSNATERMICAFRLAQGWPRKKD